MSEVTTVKCRVTALIFHCSAGYLYFVYINLYLGVVVLYLPPPSRFLLPVYNISIIISTPNIATLGLTPQTCGKSGHHQEEKQGKISLSDLEGQQGDTNDAASSYLQTHCDAAQAISGLASPENALHSSPDICVSLLDGTEQDFFEGLAQCGARQTNPVLWGMLWVPDSGMILCCS